MGDVTLTAVCIPWAGAHVTGGRRDSRRWDEHIECCQQLAELPIVPRSMLAGDFNQRLPRSRQPIRAAEALATALTSLRVWTDGEIDGHRLIDHIAATPDLSRQTITTWLGADADGHLSDHSGVVCDVSAG